LVGAAPFARSAIVHVPPLARLRLKDQRAVDASFGACGVAAIASKARPTILSCCLVEDAPKLLGVCRQLEVWEVVLLCPSLSVRMRTDAENDHADTAVLCAREKEIRPVRVDLTVGNDHEQGEVARKRIFGPFGRIGEHRFELGQLDEHSKERTGHRMRRQNQHFPPVRP
jgi:hypothetical protein